MADVLVWTRLCSLLRRGAAACTAFFLLFCGIIAWAQPRITIQTASPQPTATGGGLVRPELQKVVGVQAVEIEDRRPSAHIVLSGLSKYFSATESAKAAGLNERNWGIGYQLDIPRSKSRDAWEWNVGVGVYKDASSKVAVHAGLGASYPVWLGERWRLKAGANASVFYSQGYNNGRPFLAAVPLLNFGTDTTSLNLIVVPKIPNYLEAGFVMTQLKIALPN